MDRGIKPLCPSINTHIHAIDTISRLPHKALHHILSFLSTRDVARTRVLSKTWHRVSTSFPLSDFSESLLACYVPLKANHRAFHARSHRFLNFVHSSLLAQCHHNSIIPAFRLSTTVDLGSHFSSVIDDCLQLVALHGIKNLDLNLTAFDTSSAFYSLPQSIFSANMLTVIKLSGVRGLCLKLLPGQDVIVWPFLRLLSLTSVSVDSRLFAHCPLIEKITLIKCSGMTSLRLTGFSRLNSVKVVDDLGWITTILIDVMSLHSFHYSGGCVRCDLHVTGCKNLEVLKVKGFSVTTQVCQELISEFPALKLLVLCGSLTGDIIIPSKLLEKLRISSHHSFRVAVDAPGLRSLRCTANTTPVLFPCGTSCLQKVTLEVGNIKLSDAYLHNLHKFLLSLHNIKICITVRTLDSFTELFDGPHLPSLKMNYLKLKVMSNVIKRGWKFRVETEQRVKMLVERLFYVCRAECILVDLGWGCNKKFVEHFCSVYSPCCDACSNKFDKHGIKDVEIREFQRNGDVETFSVEAFFGKLVKPTPAPHWKIGIMIKWH